MGTDIHKHLKLGSVWRMGRAVAYGVVLSTATCHTTYKDTYLVRELCSNDLHVIPPKLFTTEFRDYYPYLDYVFQSPENCSSVEVELLKHLEKEQVKDKRNSRKLTGDHRSNAQYRATIRKPSITKLLNYLTKRTNHKLIQE